MCAHVCAFSSTCYHVLRLIDNHGVYVSLSLSLFAVPPRTTPYDVMCSSTSTHVGICIRAVSLCSGSEAMSDASGLFTIAGQDSRLTDGGDSAEQRRLHFVPRRRATGHTARTLNPLHMAVHPSSPLPSTTIKAGTRSSPVVLQQPRSPTSPVPY